ncbi:adenylate kinase [Candidatus Parcubacteria bacterium]|nr:MAG: adenylate kinase [Candidatus Parcubacteria bacterium]
MRILVFGPQGSGKGTQAELISRKYKLPYIATGDIFRFHLKSGTELGKKASRYTDAGELVPDEITNEIVKSRIIQPDCVNGFVLDGFPRNIFQAKFLNEMVEIDWAFLIDLADEKAIERLKDRLACKCGLSYHLLNNPPKVAGICDKCGNKLFIREDDKPEAINRRLEIYHQETEPVIKIYQDRGVLYKINGDQEIKKVFADIEKNISLKK